MKRILYSLVFLMFVSLFFTSAAFAQDTGSITGSVHDDSGAIISGAEITVTSSSQGVKRTTVTNAEGEYLVAGLPSGKYTLAVSAKGFAKDEIKDLVLRVAQKARFDLSLKVGNVTTDVTVTEAATTVEVQTAELSGTVTNKELTNLQLNGRNFSQFATLVPGVSNQTGQDEGAVGLGGTVQFSVNGGRTEYNNWELDGGDMMDNGSNVTLNVYPSVESIGEIKVLTSNYGAQYGRNASGTIEAVTKSGGNSFHGEAYEFLRNDAFNAKNFFNNQAVPEYKKNLFGFNLGGPVYIPNFYNQKKTKTFFFFSEEFRKDVVPGTQFNVHVPSSAERQGNFNDVCAAIPADCPINPATSSPYPGNQVPIDPNAQGLLNLISPPTVDAGANSVFIGAPAQKTNYHEELFKIDHNFSDKVSVSFRYIHDSYTTESATVLPWGQTVSSFPTIQTQENTPGISMVAHLTVAFNPTLLNEFVAGYTTDHIHLTPTGAWQRPAGSTIGGLFNNGFGGKISGIALTDANGGYGGGFTEDPSFLPFDNSNPTYTYRDNITKILGSHNLQFGAYFAAAQKNEPNVAENNGVLSFDTNSPVSTGNAFADLLTGRIAAYDQTSNTIKYYNRYKLFEPFLQDDWHVNKRLTLNLGLRVSLFGTYREINHSAYNWEPQAYNPATAPQIDVTGAITGQAGALVPGTGNQFDGIVQCGVGNAPVGCQTGHLFNPAPRLGFAWDPTGKGKTAIRGGYGIFFEHTNGNEGNSESLEGSAPLVQTGYQYNIVGYNNVGGTGLSYPLGTPGVQGVTSIPTKAIWPYIQQWHLDVQHEILKDTVATLSYVGSKGTHLTAQGDVNQILPLAVSQNPYQAGQALICPTSGPYIVNGQTLTGQALINNEVACGVNPNPFRPYQGYGVITQILPEANSIYNAMQFSLRRTVGGLFLNVAYTYSHSIDDASDRADTTFVNSYDLKSSRASSNFDQRHILSFSYVYELPFFRHPGLSHNILGGWRYSGITTYQTGTPFSVLAGVDNAGVANGIGAGAYADVVGNPNSAPAGGRYPASEVGLGNVVGPLLYNPAAFASPTGLTFGDSGRNSLRYPSRTNFDMALFKDFSIKERAVFEFRAEAFNIFNHPQWSTIDQTINTQQFLQPTAAHNPRILELALKASF